MTVSGTTLEGGAAEIYSDIIDVGSGLNMGYALNFLLWASDLDGTDTPELVVTAQYSIDGQKWVDYETQPTNFVAEGTTQAIFNYVTGTLLRFKLVPSGDDTVGTMELQGFAV